MSDTVIFMVVAGLALLFKLLTRKASSEEENPDSQPPSLPSEPAPRPAVTRPPAQSEQERVRRFLEALGAPPGSAPPPPVRSRSVRPGRVISTPTRAPRAKINRPWAQPLPPLVTTPEDQSQLPPLTTAPGPIVPAVVSVPASAQVPAAPSARPSPVASVPKTSPVPLPAKVWLGEMLRTRASARQAIILREVLDLPRSLRPIQF